MMRIAYFIHGRGRGHAVRSGAVIERICREVDSASLHIFANGEERERFDSYGDFTAIESVPRGLATFPAILRLRKLYKHFLHDSEAELVLSDGDPASLLAARAVGIPSMAVGHNVLFTRARLPESISTVAKLYEKANAWLSTVPAAAAVASSFVPLRAGDAHTVIARPDTRWTDMPRTTTGEDYLAYFRDGDDGGLIRELTSAGQTVRVYGDFHGELPTGASVRPFDDTAFLKDLATCRGVVATGGSNLITEAIYLQKPIFAVYKNLDMEQRINVEMLREANLGDGVSIERVSSKVVRAFVEKTGDGGFSTIDLASLLPTVSESVVDQIHVLMEL